MEDKKQQGRFNDRELETIKNTFGNEELLKSIRKHIFQIPLNALDQANIATNLTGKKEAMAVLRKIFLPSLAEDLPISQTVDLYYNEVDMLKSIDPNNAISLLVARKISIQYITQQLDNLEKGKDEGVRFEDLLNNIENSFVNTLTGLESFSNVLARNMIINHTQTALNNLKVLSNQKTPEQLEEEKKKNSSK